VKRLRKHAFVAVAAVAGALLLGPAGTAAASSGPFQVGEVFAGIGSGQVNRLSSAGTLLGTLTGVNTLSETTGMVFDPSGNLFVTGYNCNCISKFDNEGNLSGSFGSGLTLPESIVRDEAGNYYVGEGGSNGTSRTVLKLDSAGTQLASFDVAVDGFFGFGNIWLALAPDQCTLYYTFEGPAVKTFNVCTDTQGPDFATSLPGERASNLRLLADGGALVANGQFVVRLNHSGAVVQTYELAATTLQALNLDPDLTSFWTAANDGQIFKIDIASGSTLASFTTNIHTTLWGIAVFGEPTVAGGTGGPPATVDAVSASCAGDTLTASATAHGEAGSTFALTVHTSDDGTTFAATGQTATIAVMGSDPASYEHAFDVSTLAAQAYKVVSGTGVESNVVSASECAPGTDVPEAPAALLLPLSLLGLIGGVGLYVRRRRSAAG
jgi:hypothetical protein